MIKIDFIPENITDKIKLLDVMGTDTDIVNAARVSYGKGTKSVSDDETLLRYLMRHKHTSPFEMAELKFYVKCPIFVARQWVRHRTANWNEISGRYSEIRNEYYTPDTWKKQSITNKQGTGDTVEEYRNSEIKTQYKHKLNDIFGHYEDMIQEDIAREQARIMLPQSTYTEFIWKIDLRNLLHFLSLRMKPNAQEEIRIYAEAIAGMVEEKFPLTFRAWKDYDFNAVTFTGKEILCLTGLNLDRKHIEEMAEIHIPNKRERAEFFAKLTKLG